MLDCLSGSALLFSTYTYDEKGGFAAQSVRVNRPGMNSKRHCVFAGNMRILKREERGYDLQKFSGYEVIRPGAWHDAPACAGRQ